MTIFVHYLAPPADNSLSILEEEMVGAINFSWSTDGPVPAETQILVAGRPKPEDIYRAPGLKAVVIPWAGIPKETRELLRNHGNISVHNLHHNAGPVAELAMALLLAAAKFIVPFDSDLRNHDWRRRYRPNPSLLLSGKTALILGYGAVGRRVARMCKGFDMKVLAVRRNPQVTQDDIAEEIHPFSKLAALLPRAQLLVVCLPLTEETEGLIGEKELAQLPGGAVLVNIGRGDIVDESALYSALLDGRLLAAGLDVWYSYPAADDDRSMTKPSAFPFRQLENVVMSPHRGGATMETNKLRMISLAKLLNTHAEGGQVPNKVDLEAGY